MTTGEKLVEMSTLETGTALEHFMNISFGGGGGDTEPYPEGFEREILIID